MISLDTTIFYSLLEALAVLFIGIFALLVVQWRRRQARKQTLMDLVHRLKNSGLQRTNALQALLQQSAQLEGAQRDEVAQNILKAETHFYQFLIRALLHRDERQLLDLDREVELLTDAISKATPHNVTEINATAAAATPVAVDLAPLKQALDGLQKGQQQLAQEIKAQAESLKRSLSTLSVGAVAATATVAAAAGTGAVAAAPAESALESLPDLDDTSILAFPAADATAAPLPSDEAVSAAAPNDQIAEMPDDLLAAVGETETAPVATSAIVADAEAFEQATSTDEFEQIAELPSDILDKAAVVAETVAAEPATTTPAPETELDIDAILAGATPPEDAPQRQVLVKNTAKESAAAANSDNTAPSLDELLTAEPLLPEIETNSADTETKTEAAAGPVKSNANVDDLLAELDELLK